MCWESLGDWLKGKRIFTMASYNFGISILILKLEIEIFIIHNRCLLTWSNLMVKIVCGSRSVHNKAILLVWYVALLTITLDQELFSSFSNYNLQITKNIIWNFMIENDMQTLQEVEMKILFSKKISCRVDKPIHNIGWPIFNNWKTKTWVQLESL